MYVISAQFIVELTRHSIGLTDLLRLQTFALQHIIEISVAPDIELHRSLQLHAAFAEEPCQHSMHNCCPYLAFDIVTDHRHIPLFEALLPILFTGDQTTTPSAPPSPPLNALLHLPLD